MLGKTESQPVDIELSVGIAKAQDIVKNPNEAKVSQKSLAKQKLIAQAELGCIDALLEVADTFYGQGEFDDALYWYTQAVDNREQSDSAAAVAEYKLANMYYAGQATESDNSMAFELYSSAARRHHVEAQLQVGMMYVYGEGIPQHYGLGYAWLNAAKMNGAKSKDLNKVKKMVEKKFDKTALDNAKKLSLQWVDEAVLNALPKSKSGLFSALSGWFKK